MMIFRRSLAVAFLFFAIDSYAQSWDVNIAMGTTYTRLMPGAGSARQTQYFRYRFTGAGLYISPELYINVSEHSRFLFSYTLSDNRVGVALRAGRGGDVQRNYDAYSLQNFSVGYYRHLQIMKGKAVAGWFGKIGLAYGNHTGGGYGSYSNSTTNPNSPTYVLLEGESNEDVMPDFWMPTITLGGSLGLNKENIPALADRLTLSVSITAGLKDIYTDYAKVKYSILTLNSLETGTAQYRGLPITMQVGVNYRLFRFLNHGL